MMYIGYDGVARLLQLDEREKELDTMLIGSANEFVQGYLDREFEEIPSIVIDCVIRLFLQKKIEHSQILQGIFDKEKSVYIDIKSELYFLKRKCL